jgi:uncharacterized repeat protein (TIGR01451 family)
MNAYAKTLSVIVLAALPAGLALAQDAGCIELKTTAQTERTVIGADGKPHTQLAPATTVVPGTEVIWTITATNVCDKPAGNVAIDSPVPEHMSYVADSAAAAAVTVSYSIDGKRYGSPAAIVVREADGTTRSARADEYRHVRYAMRAPLAPGESLSASHRTRVQ